MFGYIPTACIILNEFLVVVVVVRQRMSNKLHGHLVNWKKLEKQKISTDNWLRRNQNRNKNFFVFFDFDKNKLVGIIEQETGWIWNMQVTNTKRRSDHYPKRVTTPYI
jgi:hypothetical protein